MNEWGHGQCKDAEVSHQSHCLNHGSCSINGESLVFEDEGGDQREKLAEHSEFREGKFSKSHDHHFYRKRGLKGSAEIR